MTSAFQFAKLNTQVTKTMLSNLKLFHIYVTVSHLNHGDIQENQRKLLCAAPSEEHALTWAQLNFLFNSEFNTQEELDAEILERTIKPDEQDFTASRFVGHLDVGDYKYRCIDTITEIQTEKATSTMISGSYNLTNIALNAFNPNC